MFSRGTKNLLKNTIRHTDTHNRFVEENDMWRARNKMRQIDEGSGRGAWDRHRDQGGGRERNRARNSDRDRAGAVRSTCYQVPRAHMDREQTAHSFTGREENPSTYWRRQLMKAEEEDPDRWGHGGYKQLYPDEFQSTDSEKEHKQAGKWRFRSRSPRESRKKHRKHKAKKSKKSKKYKRKHFTSESDEDDNGRKGRASDPRSQIYKMDVKSKLKEERKPQIVEIGKPDVTWVEKTQFIDHKIRKRDMERRNRIAQFQRNADEDRSDNGACVEKRVLSFESLKKDEIKHVEKVTKTDNELPVDDCKLQKNSDRSETLEEKKKHAVVLEKNRKEKIFDHKQKHHDIKKDDNEAAKNKIKQKKVIPQVVENSSESSSETSSQSSSSEQFSRKSVKKRPRSESESSTESEESDSETESSPERQHRNVKNGSKKLLSKTSKRKHCKLSDSSSSSSSESSTSSSSDSD